MQRAGWGIRVLAMGEKWRRGIDGVEGEAVMEEVGTWWRTLGPVVVIVSMIALKGDGVWTFVNVEDGEKDCFEHGGG